MSYRRERTFAIESRPKAPAACRPRKLSPGGLFRILPEPRAPGNIHAGGEHPPYPRAGSIESISEKLRWNSQYSARISAGGRPEQS